MKEIPLPQQTISSCFLGTEDHSLQFSKELRQSSHQPFISLMLQKTTCISHWDCPLSDWCVKSAEGSLARGKAGRNSVVKVHTVIEEIICRKTWEWGEKTVFR